MARGDYDGTEDYEDPIHDRRARILTFPSPAPQPARGAAFCTDCRRVVPDGTPLTGDGFCPRCAERQLQRLLPIDPRD